MELRDLLRLCNGRQVHDLIFFQKRLSEARKRIKLAVCERNILFWEQTQGAYITVTGDLGDTWFVEGDHIELFGRYVEMSSAQIDGTSYTMPHIEANSVYFWMDGQYSDSERFDVKTITKVAEAVSGNDVEVREAVYQEDMMG